MAKETLKDRAYELIKNKIINCEYPPNSFLIESEVMELVNASRTPIREALVKLEKEKLVHIFPKRGIVVSNIDRNAVREIFELRLLIEPYIIRNYADRISVDFLESEHAVFREKLVDFNRDSFARDDNLHKMVIQCSENPYFISTMDQIYSQNHRLRILSGNVIGKRLEETRKEHLLIVKYLLKKNFPAAAEAMVLHLKASEQAAYKSMDINNQVRIQSS